MKPKTFQKSEKFGRKYAMLTAYDALTSRLLEAAGVDFILVGDSVGMVLLGYPSTTLVTMEEMMHHAKAARRGAPKTFMIGDLPKKGIDKGPRQALESAKRFAGEAGMDAVKIEWNKNCLKATELVVKNGVPVQGHVGLTPQAVKAGEFKVQGKTALQAEKILKQAKAFEQAGASLLVLECIPWEVAKVITDQVTVPTIGIGAGPYCDGQVLVYQDLVGAFDSFKPKFVKRYAETAALSKKAVHDYIQEVRQGRFPGFGQSFTMDPAELATLNRKLQSGNLR